MYYKNHRGFNYLFSLNVLTVLTEYLFGSNVKYLTKKGSMGRNSRSIAYTQTYIQTSFHSSILKDLKKKKKTH